MEEQYFRSSQAPFNGYRSLDAYGDGTSASVWRNNNDAKTKLDCLKKVDHRSFQLARFIDTSLLFWVCYLIGMSIKLWATPYNQSKIQDRSKKSCCNQLV